MKVGDGIVYAVGLKKVEAGVFYCIYVYLKIKHFIIMNIHIFYGIFVYILYLYFSLETCSAAGNGAGIGPRDLFTSEDHTEDSSEDLELNSDIDGLDSEEFFANFREVINSASLEYCDEAVDKIAEERSVVQMHINACDVAIGENREETLARNNPDDLQDAAYAQKYLNVQLRKRHKLENNMSLLQDYMNMVDNRRESLNAEPPLNQAGLNEPDDLEDSDQGADSSPDESETPKRKRVKRN